MSNTQSFPCFISNAPCGIDLFESRSQTRTAKSISDHIKAGDKDYRLIGLDGEWGSGKSNAVSIIGTQLDKNYHLFIYDTWAHQEDLQRRSFIEELTDDLQQKHVVDQEEWRKNLDDLLAKKKVTVTKTIPRLSYAIVGSLLVAATSPLTKVISDGLPSEEKLLKVLVAASPLLLAIIVWLIASIKNKENWNLSQLFSIYEKKDLEKISDETISESEPSLREFRNWVRKLNQESKKKIVIVFDNMDRLPPEKIKIIWTLLHTFFSANEFDKFWIIVPFDRKHIRDAFGAGSQDKDFEKTNHFINKTFSVIFNISPAVVTDWKKFFEKKYFDAFGEEEKSEYIITRKIFDLYSTSITPRKIIAFINEMVALKLVWGKEIKLRYIAVFVLNRQVIAENPSTEILGNSFLAKSKNLFAGDQSVSDNIAALFYNVPIQKAAQVTLQRAIQLAIREKRVTDLKEFSKSSDFISILEQIEPDDIEVESTVYSLNQIQPEGPEPDAESYQVIWDRVLGRQFDLQLQSIDLTPTHKLLMQRIRKYQQPLLVNYLLKEYHSAHEFSGAKYFTVLSDLESFLAENSIDINIAEIVREKELPPNEFFAYLTEAKEAYSNFKVKCNNDLLDKFFVEKLADSPKLAPLVNMINEVYKFPLLKTELENKITQENFQLDDFLNIFDMYKAAFGRKVLPIRLTDERIAAFLSHSAKGTPEYYELAAMRIAKGSSFSGEEATEILENTDDTFIKEVAGRIEYYDTYGNLLLLAVDWPQPALKSILRQLTEENDTVQYLNIVQILPSFKNIAAALELSEEVLFGKLNGWRERLKGTLSVNNLTLIVADFTLYESAMKTNNSLTQNIFDVAILYVDHSTKEEWDQAFLDTTSYLFNLLGILLNAEKIASLPANAFSSYKDALRSIAANPGDYSLATGSANYWSILYSKADQAYLQPVIKDVRDLFINDIHITADQFVFFEALLRNQGQLLEKSGDVVRKILVPGINDATISLLVDNRTFYSRLIVKAGNDAFDLIEMVREKIEAGGAGSELEEFGRMINADLSKEVNILFAKYASKAKPDKFIDVTAALKRIVEQEGQIHFLVDNGISQGKDPDPGIEKRLYVKFTYLGTEKEKLFDEHKWLRLP